MAHPRSRDALAAALVRQQEERGAPRAAARARALEHPDSVAVVTGQQAGLFGGPLFVLHKALATLEVSRQLTERRRNPAVPVFWVASEDHDFAEVRTACVLDGSGVIRDFRYAPRVEPSGQPAFEIVLDETIERLVNELGEALPDEPEPGRDRGDRPQLLPPRGDALRGVRPAPLPASPGPRGPRPLGPRPQGPHGAGAVPGDPGGLAELPARPRGRPGPPRGRVPPAGPGPAGLPEPVRPHGRRPSGPWLSPTMESRCAASGRHLSLADAARLVEEEPRPVERQRAPAPHRPGRDAAHRGVRRGARRDRLPRPDRLGLRALRRSPPGAGLPAQRHPRGARPSPGP